MLYIYYQQLTDLWHPFNVFRYVSFRIMAGFATSLILTLILYPGFIRFLKRKKMGQVVREDGPKQHYSKEGTPIMGGVLILASILLNTLLWTDITSPLVQFTALNGLLFGMIGFIDDYKKVMEHDYKGLSGKIRLALEFLIVFGLFYWFYASAGPAIGWDLKLYIPFVSTRHFAIHLPFLIYLLFAGIVVVGTSNATNLTDGMDGLAAGVIITGSGAFVLLAYLAGAKLGGFDISKYLLLPKVDGASELAIIAASVAGATTAFLYFNTYPATVFMGDTGALGLGAILGSLALLTKNELLSVIIFGIFVLEAVSVMAQTIHYKLTHRRLIKMAPVHYTFLLLGWDEPKIVVRAWIISVLLAIFALASIKVR